MRICGNTSTDALHAAHFELLVSSVQNQVGWSVFFVSYPGQHYVCARTCVLPYCSSCLWYIWNSNHMLGAHACFFISLCLLFASVGQASARTIAALPWTLFTSLLTHRLVLLCIDAHCFILWDLPGDVLAAPESALGLDRCNASLSLSLSLSWDLPGDVLAAPESALCAWIGVILLSLSLSLSIKGICEMGL